MTIINEHKAVEMDFLRGGGKMGERIRRFPWHTTTLGPPEAWPLSLRTVVRLMLTTNHPVFIFWGEETLCLYNDAYSRSLGPEKHPAILGVPARKAWAEIWDIIGPQIEQVMLGRGATWHENQLVPIERHGGISEVYWTYSYSPIEAPTFASGVGGVLVLCTETTKQILASEQLKAARKRWESLFEQAPGFTCVLRGPGHVFEFANPAYFKLVGRSDFIGQPIREVFPWAVKQGFVDILDTVYNSGRPYLASATQVTLPDRQEPDSQRYLDFIYQPIINEDNHVEGIFVQGTDATERKRAETLLDAQKDSLELVVRGAPLSEVLNCLAVIVEEQSKGDAVASILLLDEHGCLHNGASPSLPADYLEAIDGLRMDPDHGTCCAAAATARVVITRDIATDSKWSRLKHLPLGLGLRAAWSNPIKSGSGHVLGTFGTYFRSSREPTPAERQAVEILSHTAALAIESARAEEALRDADKRKDEFLATLAHELRNPLAPLTNGVELLRRAPSDARLREQTLGILGRQTQQLVMLVNDLMDISRISRGKLELRTQKVLLGDVVQNALDTVSPLIERGKHQFSRHLAEHDIHLMADPSRLCQVFANLLNNAAKYTPQGGNISLTLEVSGSTALISISDDGIGIPQDKQQRIFDMFAQVNRPQESGFTGLGIGLTLVKYLVDQHGGTIAVHSEGEGRGSTFIVELPVLDPDDIQARATDTAASPGPRRFEQKVLLVDDNRPALEILEILLARYGCQVRTAGDGGEAYDIAREFLPDLILMDLGMPVMNGYEAAARIRAQAWGKDMKLVALSGWGQAEDRQRTREAGFDEHFIKPVAMEQIESLLTDS